MSNRASTALVLIDSLFQENYDVLGGHSLKTVQQNLKLKKSYSYRIKTLFTPAVTGPDILTNSFSINPTRAQQLYPGRLPYGLPPLLTAH